MIVVLVSVMMKDITRLRVINSIACAMFIIYGLALGAYPIVVMNFFVIVINLYRLKKNKK